MADALPALAARRTDGESIKCVALMYHNIVASGDDDASSFARRGAAHYKLDVDAFRTTSMRSPPADHGSDRSTQDRTDRNARCPSTTAAQPV